MEALNKLGRGAGQGLGYALTPLAMAQAARSGRNPFDVLEEIQGGDMRRRLQAAQLADLQQKGLLNRAQAMYDPAMRGFLLANPQAAGAFGIPMETVSGASAEFPVPSGLGAQPQRIEPTQPSQQSIQQPALPPMVDTKEELARRELKGRIDWQNTLRNFVAGGGAKGSAPSGMRLTGFTGTTPTFGVVPTREYPAGMVNPATGKPFQPGEVNPSGEPVVVKPSPAAQANKARLSQIQSAMTTFSQIYNTPLDPNTGEPTNDPNGVLPHTVLPKPTDYFGTAGALSEIAPGMASLATRLRGQYGSEFTKKAVARLKTGEGTVVGIVKANGDAANISEKEQDRAIAAFLPQTGDTEPVADMKRRLTPQILQKMHDRLAGLEEQLGQMDPKDAAALVWAVVAQSASEMEAATAGVGTVTPGAPVPGATPSPASPAPATPAPAAPAGATPVPGLEDVNARRQKLGLPPISQHAKGGSIPKGRTGLVGEGRRLELVSRPTLVAGPANVQPLQLAAGSTPWAPRQIQPPQEPAPKQLQPLAPAGVRTGEGMRPEDIERARGGGTQVIWDPIEGRPVVVPR